jgi:hypothetical protein
VKLGKAKKQTNQSIFETKKEDGMPEEKEKTGEKSKVTKSAG